VSDKDAVAMVYRLLREEGLFVGGSTGINMCAAMETARKLGPGHTVVSLLCDRGSLYFKRLFNPDWLREKGLSPS
jgi:cysteine synthase A